MAQGNFTARFYCYSSLGALNDSEYSIAMIDTVAPAVWYHEKMTANNTQVNNSLIVYANVFDRNFRNASYVLTNSSGTIASADSEYHYVSKIEQYERYVNNTDLSLSADSSGITYNPETNTLFVIHNTAGSESIQEIHINGSLIRTITLTGFDDTEGIGYANTSGDTHRFFVVEERRANPTEIFLTSETTTFAITSGVRYD